jgi:hypothetical protein
MLLVNVLILAIVADSAVLVCLMASAFLPDVTRADEFIAKFAKLTIWYHSLDFSLRSFLQILQMGEMVSLSSAIV